MLGGEEAEKLRKLNVDLEELGAASQDWSWQMSYFLSLETGRMVTITQETRCELDEIYEEAPP